MPPTGIRLGIILLHIRIINFNIVMLCMTISSDNPAELLLPCILFHGKNSLTMDGKSAYMALPMGALRHLTFTDYGIRHVPF